MRISDWSSDVCSSDLYASTRKGNKIYLHVLNTDTATIELKKIPGRKIQSAAVLGGKQVNIIERDVHLLVKLPSSGQSRLNYIIELTLDGAAASIPFIR